MSISKKDYLERADNALKPVESLLQRWRVTPTVPIEINTGMVQLALQTAQILINAANVLHLDDTISGYDEEESGNQIKKIPPENFIIQRG